MTSTAAGPASPQSPSTPEGRQDHRVGDAVRQLVITLLPDGYPDVRRIAEMMRLSPRTLQRRLGDEGLTFARMVARARFDVAQGMLADPTRRVIDVALELGYSDPAHFTRAFARWTGLAPREFQRLRLTGHLGTPFPRSAVREFRRDQSAGLAATRRGE